VRVLILLVLLSTGCARTNAAAERQQSPCSQQLFEGSRFTVCDAAGGRLKLFAALKSETPVRSFAELQTKIDPAKVAFAMNAGMFDEDGRPIGLAVADRVLAHGVNLRDGGGNFHLKPNGIFLVRRGKPEVIASAPFSPESAAAIDLATQSGPMLVIDGKLHPKLQADGQSRYIRNGVGVRGGKALFVISEDPVSLGKFARFFRDGLKTPNALYFDGSVSSLWDPANGRQDSHVPLGPIVIAFKPAASKPGRASPSRP
jgi:uncharacterized protein YigE (DUF2233 family)